MSDRDLTKQSSYDRQLTPTETGKNAEGYSKGKNEHVVEIFPNPLTATSKLIVQLCRAEYVRAHVYDIGGELVQRLFDGFMEAGEFRIPLKRRTFQNDTCICIVEIDGFKYHQVLTSGA